jgi:hypothetical protein
MFRQTDHVLFLLLVRFVDASMPAYLSNQFRTGAHGVGGWAPARYPISGISYLLVDNMLSRICLGIPDSKWLLTAAMSCLPSECCILM